MDNLYAIIIAIIISLLLICLIFAIVYFNHKTVLLYGLTYILPNETNSRVEINDRNISDENIGEIRNIITNYRISNGVLEFRNCRFENRIQNLLGESSQFTCQKSVSFKKCTMNIDDYSNFFSGCSSIETIDFSRCIFNFNDNASIDYLCYNLKNLKSVEFDILCLFYFKNCTNISMRNIFSGCEKLEKITYNGYNEKAYSKNESRTTFDLTSAFENCESLNSISNNMFLTSYSSEAKHGPNFNIENMFYNCINLSEVTFNHARIEGSLAGTFAGCESLEKINLYYVTVKIYDSMCNLFLNCKNFNKINYMDPDSSYPINDVSIEILSTDENLNFDLTSAFEGCSSISTFPGDLITTTHQDITFSLKINNLNYRLNSLFKNCENLTNLDLYDWNFNEVAQCQKRIVTIGGTGKEFVDDTTGYPKKINLPYTDMFEGCIGIKYIRLNKDQYGLQTLTCYNDYQEPSNHMYMNFDNCYNIIHLKFKNGAVATPLATSNTEITNESIYVWYKDINICHNRKLVYNTNQCSYQRGCDQCVNLDINLCNVFEDDDEPTPEPNPEPTPEPTPEPESNSDDVYYDNGVIRVKICDL